MRIQTAAQRTVNEIAPDQDQQKTPKAPNHSTTATAKVDGHAASSFVTKAAPDGSDGKLVGNNSECISSFMTSALR